MSVIHICEKGLPCPYRYPLMSSSALARYLGPVVTPPKKRYCALPSMPWNSVMPTWQRYKREFATWKRDAVAHLQSLTLNSAHEIA